MIKKEEYKKALEIVKSYEEQVNSQLVNNRTCCVCKENTISTSVKHTHPLKQEQGMWSNGTVEKIKFGYGSIVDTDSYYVAICDICIEELEKEGLATNFKKLESQFRKTIIEIH